METVKQNTFKYKILFIFSFSLLLLLLFNTNVFAGLNYIFEDKYYVVPDTLTSSDGTLINTSNYNHIIVLQHDSVSHWVLLYNTDSEFLKASEVFSEDRYKFTNDIINWCRYRYIDGSYELILFDDSTYNTYISPTIVYSDLDIYDKQGNLVFPVPVQEITLAQVLEKEKAEKPEMVLKEIVLILPLIIVIVVSFLGLRKALRILSTLLHRA